MRIIHYTVLHTTIWIRVLTKNNEYSTTGVNLVKKKGGQSNAISRRNLGPVWYLNYKKYGLLIHSRYKEVQNIAILMNIVLFDTVTEDQIILLYINFTNVLSTPFRIVSL